MWAISNQTKRKSDRMLSKEVLEDIHNGRINSRRQLYRIVGGRSRALRKWLDANNLLVPTRWNKDRIKARLRDMAEELGRLPKASDSDCILSAAQHHFGTWNNAMYETFGVYNQRRYDGIDLLAEIKRFVKENGRIPLREEFDGKDFPYWEAITTRHNVKTWAEVIALVDFTGVTFHPVTAKRGFGGRHVNGVHGWGKVYKYEDTVYLSHSEYLIGKYLTDNGIKFDKEVLYTPFTRERFDFYLPQFDVYIEYYGIATPEYKERIEKKRSMYEGRAVIEIFKHDNTIAKLSSEVQRLQSSIAQATSDKV